MKKNILLLVILLILLGVVFSIYYDKIPFMKNITGDSILKVPGAEETQTYIISNIAKKPDSISVYPVLESDNVCSGSAKFTQIIPCPSA